MGTCTGCGMTGMKDADEPGHAHSVRSVGKCICRIHIYQFNMKLMGQEFLSHFSIIPFLCVDFGHIKLLVTMEMISGSLWVLYNNIYYI